MRVIIEPHTIGVFPYVKSLAKYTTVRKPTEIKLPFRRLTILVKISDSFFLVKNHNLLTSCKFLRLKYIQTVILFFLLASKYPTMHWNLNNIKILIGVYVKVISLNYFSVYLFWLKNFMVVFKLKEWSPSSKFNSSNLVLFIGVIKNGGVKPNIIPSYSELIYYFRAPSMKELPVLTKKAEDCFRAAALATGCTVRTFKS